MTTYTNEQHKFAHEVKRLSGNIDKNRFELAACIAQARDAGIDAWADIAAETVGRKKPTIYEWAGVHDFIHSMPKRYPKLGWSKYAELSRYADKLSEEVLADLAEQACGQMTVEELRDLLRLQLDNSDPSDKATRAYDKAIVSLKKIKAMPFIPQALLFALEMAIETLEKAQVTDDKQRT